MSIVYDNLIISNDKLNDILNIYSSMECVDQCISNIPIAQLRDTINRGIFYNHDHTKTDTLYFTRVTTYDHPIVAGLCAIRNMFTNSNKSIYPMNAVETLYVFSHGEKNGVTLGRGIDVYRINHGQIETHMILPDTIYYEGIQPDDTSVIQHVAAAFTLRETDMLEIITSIPFGFYVWKEPDITDYLASTMLQPMDRTPNRITNILMSKKSFEPVRLLPSEQKSFHWTIRQHLNDGFVYHDNVINWNMFSFETESDKFFQAVMDDTKLNSDLAGVISTLYILCYDSIKRTLQIRFPAFNGVYTVHVITVPNVFVLYSGGVYTECSESIAMIKAAFGLSADDECKRLLGALPIH